MGAWCLGHTYAALLVLHACCCRYDSRKQTDVLPACLPQTWRQQNLLARCLAALSSHRRVLLSIPSALFSSQLLSSSSSPSCALPPTPQIILSSQAPTQQGCKVSSSKRHSLSYQFALTCTRDGCSSAWCSAASNSFACHFSLLDQFALIHLFTAVAGLRDFPQQEPHNHQHERACGGGDVQRPQQP